MKIIYDTKTEFYNGIAELVKRGVMFEANGETLTIELTGGI